MGPIGVEKQVWVVDRDISGPNQQRPQQNAVARATAPTHSLTVENPKLLANGSQDDVTDRTDAERERKGVGADTQASVLIVTEVCVKKLSVNRCV